MNVIDEIKAIVARESASPSNDPLRWRIRDAISRLPGIDHQEFQALRWLEYDIDISANTSANTEAEILRWLRSLEIVAAPEVAATISFEGGDCVLVRRYWACPGERLLPARVTQGPFREAARMRFRKDMEKLVEHGKVHPYARGLSHMLVGETSGTLLLNAWAIFRSGTPHEQKELLETIDLLLATRT